MFFQILILCIVLIFISKIVSGVSKKKKSIAGKHVWVTGGSSGIGKSVAILLAQMGANVTIVARRSEQLLSALNELKDHKVNSEQIFKTVSIDCSKHDAINSIIDSADQQNPIYMLVNCVGVANCGRLENMSEADIKSMVDINYYATVYPVKCLIPKMQSRREGIIVITGSQASLFGLYGLSIYSSVKFALRGFAEALHMENRDFNISITLALPPDTDTPGYKIENENKPIETKLISESAGLFRPDDVAKKIINDALDGKFFSTIGLESWILTTLCAGMSPFTHLFDVIVEAIVLGPLRLISIYYLHSFHKIVTECLKKEVKEKDN